MSVRLQRRAFCTTALAAVSASWAPLAIAQRGRSPRTLTWDDLVPKDWDPVALLKDKQQNIFDDTDPRAQKAMRQLRELWDAAPTVAALDAQLVRLPGYVVPLEYTEGELTELLLVPYFGACIHTPPPPANQIVHINLAKAQRVRSMETVWVSGTMRTKRGDSPWGKSGYTIERATLAPYER